MQNCQVCFYFGGEKDDETMSDETTKLETPITRTAASEALDALINTIAMYLARHPLDVFLTIARIVALLPGDRPELRIGLESCAAVDLVMRLPGARFEETISPRAYDRGPYVIRYASAEVRGLLIRAQHTREPTLEELARLEGAVVDPTPRVKPVVLSARRP